MKILGIDPGTGITGFGAIEVNGQAKKLLDAGVIRTPANSPLPERLQTIRDEVAEITKSTLPDIAAIETLFFFRNVTTAISVAHARGVLVLALHDIGIPIVEYTPLQVKMAITGYGRASKQQIQEMVRVQLGLQEVPKPDDCADALAVALTYIPTK